MFRRCHLWIPLFLLILSSAAVPSGAADLRPPDYRSLPQSLVAGWEFLTEQDVYAVRPDADVPLKVGDAASPLQEKFPAGGPYPLASIFGDVAYTHADDGGYYGTSSHENGLVFVVPNWLGSQAFQQLRVQVTFQGPAPPVAVKAFAGIPGTTAQVKPLPIMRVPVADSALAGSSFFYEDWVIDPSSTWLQVFVFLREETILQGVVIDSLSGSHPFFEDGYEEGE